MANLVLYSININGISTKFDSFLEILRRLSPDIVSVCKLKTSQLGALSVKLKEENYEIVPQRKSGIAIIAMVSRKMLLQRNERASLKNSTLRLNTA